MIIKKDILELMFTSCPITPPEIGGIIGSSADNIISHYIIDNGIQKGCGCYYTPDTKLLNKVISNWNNNSITFKGIFHSHYFGNKTLSKGDIDYIKQIMNAMPSSINFLYFPIIVMPNKELVSYKVFRSNGNVIIEDDEITIL